MTTLHSLTSHAQPAGPEFRPLKAPPTGTYRIREGGRLEVTLTKRGKATTYHIIGISCELAGAAFRWHKLGGSGDVYDLMLSGTDSTCTCPGFCYTSGCKHLHCTRKLIDLGVLTVAPGSACDADGAEAAA